jgi:hypothetical protein
MGLLAALASLLRGTTPAKDSPSSASPRPVPATKR